MIAIAAVFLSVQLAEVFLGGSSSEEACVAMSPDDFDDAIDGLDLLVTGTQDEHDGGIDGEDVRL
jgi:hypothetical protein